MSISITEQNLLKLLASLQIERDTIHCITELAETDENRQEMIWAICDRYEEKGIVTEQDVQKIGLMLTGTLKKEYRETN